MNIERSQGLHTTVMRRGKGHNSALVSIGAIDIDIPQHPVVLHGMMTRGTRQLSTTLQEFRRPIPRSRCVLCVHLGIFFNFCKEVKFSVRG